MLTLDRVNKSLQCLVGLRLNESILIGPAGFELFFGEPDAESFWRKHGIYSLFIECPFKIYINRIRLCLAGQDNKEMQKSLNDALVGRLLTQISVDFQNSGLKILFEDITLFTAYPSSGDINEAELWCFYDFSDNPDAGFLISKNQIWAVNSDSVKNHDSKE